MRESDGGAQPHYLYLVNNYAILHSNDSTGHGVPSAASSGPQSSSHRKSIHVQSAILTHHTQGAVHTVTASVESLITLITETLPQYHMCKVGPTDIHF